MGALMAVSHAPCRLVNRQMKQMSGGLGGIGRAGARGSKSGGAGSFFGMVRGASRMARGGQWGSVLCGRAGANELRCFLLHQGASRSVIWRCCCQVGVGKGRVNIALVIHVCLLPWIETL